MKFYDKSDLAALATNTKIGLLTLLFVFPPYVIVNNFFYDRAAVNLALPIDHFFPFNHYWITVYAWVYVFIFLPIFIVKTKAAFKNVAKGYIMVNFISVAIFIIMPAKYPRPDVLTQDEFLWWGAALNYLLDKPVNCFPSLHVANAFFASMTAFHYWRRVGLIAWLLAILVSLSTLFMKQHFVVDIFSGFVVAFFVYRFYFLRRMRAIGNQERMPEWMSLGVVVVYLVFVGSMYALFSAGVQLPLNKIVH